MEGSGIIYPTFLLDRDCNIHISVLEAKCEPSGEDPTGRVGGGVVEIQGPLRCIDSKEFTELSSRTHDWFYFPDVKPPEKFFILNIYSARENPAPENQKTTYALALKHVVDTDSFERIGVAMQCWIDGEKEYDLFWATAEERTLIII